jgi:thiol-disulfide isomerase/thioredoxin
VYAGKDGGKDGGKEAPRHVVRAQYLDGELEGIVTMLNGGKLMQIDATKKTYTDALDIGGSMLGIAFAACPDWYRDDFGPARMGAPLQLELAGTANIDGLECDLVKVVREIEIGLMDPGQEQPEMQKIPLSELVAFARVDGLPRRVTMGAPMLGGMEEEGNPSGPEVTISAVKLNPKLDDAQFALTAPEGYAKVEPKMPEFAQPAMEGGPAEQLKVKAGDAAPDFKLKDLAGSEVSLASLKGKVVLLDFWATWCGPCKAAMPTMQKLHDEYGSKGVVILGVNTWEQKADAAKDYMASKKFTYGCLLRGDDLAAAYGIKGIPTLVVIGKDGKIAEIEVGLSDPSGGALRKALDALLGK